MSTQATATSELRWVERESHSPDEPRIQLVLQRRFHAVENPGNSNERSFYLWLDVPLHIESKEERAMRIKAENDMASRMFTLQWPATKLFG